MKGDTLYRDHLPQVSLVVFRHQLRRTVNMNRTREDPLFWLKLRLGRRTRIPGFMGRIDRYRFTRRPRVQLKFDHRD